MKRLALLLIVAAIGASILAQAAILRVTSTVTASTNATATTGATLQQYGTLHRAVITVTGGTSDVAVVDSDGTELLSTNLLTGSYTWTGTAYAFRPLVKTSNANTTNVSVSILMTLDK